MRLYKVLVLLVILLVIACDDSGEGKMEISSTINESTTNNSTQVNIEPAADTFNTAELVQESAEALFTLGENLIKKHKEKDSIRAAEREKLFAYRIGLPINDKDQVFEMYNKLTATENIYALKQSRQDYYLVYYNGYSKKQLEDSLEAFRAKLPTEFKNTLKVVNIMELCSDSRQNLMVGEKLTKRKSDDEIPCLICDK